MSDETPDLIVETATLADAYAELEEVHTTVRQLVGDNEQLAEDLDRTRAQFDALRNEDIGWQLLYGQSFEREETGLTLDTLKKVSKLLREEVAGSALPKKANEARYAHTFGRQFIIPGLNKTAEVKRGRPSNSRVKSKSVSEFLKNPSVDRYVMSEEAQVAMHTASSTDGCYLLLGDDASKKVHPIPLREIAGVFCNPDFADEVWAYLREWTTYGADGEGETVKKWYYTDRYDGERKSTIPTSTGNVPVDRGSTMIDAVFNGQVGWTYGIPDLMAGQIWNRKYLTMIAYGEKVTEALAYYTAKVKNQSKAGSDNVGVTLAKGGAGRTVTYGEGNAVDVFQTAGKTYDFGGLRVFASFYAAAVGLPLTDLTADPSAAGASYGSAAALIPGARRSIEARRSQWADWMARVIKWGTGEDVEVIPESIVEEDAYRTAQKVVMAWNSGLFHEDEIRGAMAEITGVTLLHPKAPDGVLLPNNKESWERSDIDPKENPDAVPSTAASPDQGKSNGSGGSDDATKKDNRSDKVSTEFLKSMENSETLEKLETILALLQDRVV